MGLIKNLFAVIGVVATVVALAAGAYAATIYSSARHLDPQARHVYADYIERLLQSGSAAEAGVWKRAVEQGLTPADVERSMKSAAIDRNIKDVGELPLYKQVEAATGRPYRFVKIFMFCSALTAARMIEYDPAYAAYLPCRVTLLEDGRGRLWLYTLNLDPMIYGGKPLPPDLKAEALKVRETLLAILDRGASGAF